MEEGNEGQCSSLLGLLAFTCRSDNQNRRQRCMEEEFMNGKCGLNLLIDIHVSVTLKLQYMYCRIGWFMDEDVGLPRQREELYYSLV